MNKFSSIEQIHTFCLYQQKDVCVYEASGLGTRKYFEEKLNKEDILTFSHDYSIRLCCDTGTLPPCTAVLDVHHKQNVARVQTCFESHSEGGGNTCNIPRVPSSQ